MVEKDLYEARFDEVEEGKDEVLTFTPRLVLDPRSEGGAGARGGWVTACTLPPWHRVSNG